MKSSLSVYAYSDFRQYLKDFFDNEKKRDPKFSHRYFAGRLGLAASNFILLVIQGKRNITRATCFKISGALGHNPDEAAYFENLVNYGQAKALIGLASGATNSSQALQALDPRTGDLLWWCCGAGDVSSPAYGSGLVYFDSGRNGRSGVAVEPTGTGDVSETKIRWTLNQVPEGLSSPIIVGSHLYRLHTSRTLKCWEMSTGKLAYAQRLEGLSTVWASPIADARGRLFFANAGKSYVVQSGPEFKLLAINDLGDGNHPSPAVAKGKLFLVGLKNIYCIANQK